jgi:type 1 glutamine amidotransferase
VTAGVPASFRVDDELYHFEPDASGPARHVLATGRSDAGATFPVAWTVARGKGRIVCLTLGHDAAAHDHAAYKTMLRNAVAWAGGAR